MTLKDFSSYKDTFRDFMSVSFQILNMHMTSMPMTLFYRMFKLGGSDSIKFLNVLFLFVKPILSVVNVMTD